MSWPGVQMNVHCSRSGHIVWIASMQITAGQFLLIERNKDARANPFLDQMFSFLYTASANVHLIGLT